jgi:hypothetical protein
MVFRTLVLVSALLAPATVGSRLAEHGPAARSRLAPAFARAGVAYPPRAVTLVGLKREARLEVYAGSRRGAEAFVSSYPILAAPSCVKATSRCRKGSTASSR